MTTLMVFCRIFYKSSRYKASSYDRQGEIVVNVLVLMVYIVVCVLLVIAILLQPGKSGDLGAVSGGFSQTFFGGGGATTFLVKTTAVLATIFMLLSLFITIHSSKNVERSVIETPVSQSSR